MLPGFFLAILFIQGGFGSSCDFSLDTETRFMRDNDRSRNILTCGCPEDGKEKCWDFAHENDLKMSFECRNKCRNKDKEECDKENCDKIHWKTMCNRDQTVTLSKPGKELRITRPIKDLDNGNYTCTMTDKDEITTKTYQVHVCDTLEVNVTSRTKEMCFRTGGEVKFGANFSVLKIREDRTLRNASSIKIVWDICDDDKCQTIDQSEKEGNLSVTFGDPCRFSVAASLEILSLNKTHMNRKLVCRLFLDGRSSQDVDFPLTEKTMTGRFCYEKDPKLNLIIAGTTVGALVALLLAAVLINVCLPFIEFRFKRLLSFGPQTQTSPQIYISSVDDDDDSVILLANMFMKWGYSVYPHCLTNSKGVPLIDREPAESIGQDKYEYELEVIQRSSTFFVLFTEEYLARFIEDQRGELVSYQFYQFLHQNWGNKNIYFIRKIKDIQAAEEAMNESLIDCAALKGAVDIANRSKTIIWGPGPELAGIGQPETRSLLGRIKKALYAHSAAVRRFTHRRSRRRIQCWLPMGKGDDEWEMAEMPLKEST